MQSDFEALIQRYESLCNQSGESTADDMLGLDQKVPQSIKGHIELVQADDKIERLLRASETKQTFSDYLAEEFMLHPVQSNGPICVTDVTDHVTQRGESPDLLDLDQVGGQDISLYENNDTLKIKEEPFKTECCMDIESYHIPNFYTTEEQNFRDMESRIIQGLKQDIDATCCCLQINPDPLCWNLEEVHKWIEWQCRVYHFTHVNLEYFQMTGTDLCCLAEEEFKLRAPEAGTTLYSQLDIWRCARDLPSGISYTAHAQPSFDQYSIPAPSVSPTPSYSSDDSLSTESSMSPLSYEAPHAQVPLTESFTTQTRYEERLPEEPEHKPQIQLWQFLKQLLLQPDQYKNFIKWVDRSSGIFKIEDSVKVAKLWGLRKKRPAMNYDKLSRSIRQYYKKGIIKKTEQSKRLVYQFCSPYL